MESGAHFVFNPLVRLLGALLVGAMSAGAAAAFTLTSDEGRFTVELPDKPSFQVRRLASKDGAILESNEWMVDQPWLMWLVSYRDHPQNAEDASPEKIFERLIHELPNSLDGKLRSHHFFEREGAQGLEIRIFVPRNRMLLRSQIFVVHKRQYAISYVGPDGSENEPKVETYLNSFHVLR